MSRGAYAASIETGGCAAAPANRAAPSQRHGADAAADAMAAAPWRQAPPAPAARLTPSFETGGGRAAPSLDDGMEVDTAGGGFVFIPAAPGLTQSTLGNIDKNPELRLNFFLAPDLKIQI